MAPELIARVDQMRRNRHAEIERTMAEVDAANARLSAAHVEVRAARLQIASAKARLAQLIEHGERKVVNNHLVTLNATGGLHIEPVEVLGQLGI